MSHTPTVPADERALRFIEKADVPEEHLVRLRALLERVHALAAEAGAVDKLQAEFGADHVAVIHDCNQFTRIYKRGSAAGRVELFLPDAAKAALKDAGFTLHEPLGQVFKLFGWIAVDPMEGDMDALETAVAAAYTKARK